MDITEAVREIVRSQPTTIALYLFGSRAHGVANRSSGLDLAILTTEPIDPVARFELPERIARALRTSVDLIDLVDLRPASTVLRAQMLEHGEVLHDGDPVERARFEMTVLSDYARLDEERRGILDDVGRTGRVHG